MRQDRYVFAYPYTQHGHIHVQDTSKDGDEDRGGQSVTKQINNTSLGMLKGV